MIHAEDTTVCVVGMWVWLTAGSLNTTVYVRIRMKYQYKTTYSTWSKLETVLNAWGEQGWRLANMSTLEDDCYLVFERSDGKKL